MPGNPNTHYSAKLYLGVADGTANATTVISDPYLFVRENGSNTAVQLKGGTGINISGINGAATISLANTTVTAGTYGPSTDVSGANGNVIKVPQITVDAQGRITSVIEKEYTSVDTNTDTNTAHAHSNPANSGLKLTGTGGTSGTVQYSVNTDFTTSASARKYKVEVDSTSGGLYVNVPWTDTNTDTNTTYTAGTGLTLNSTTFSLATSGVEAGEYGPTTNVTGNNGAEIKIPRIEVDAYGRVTSITHYTYTSVNTDTNTDTNTAHAHSAGIGLTISGSGGISGTTTYSANLKSTTSLGTIGTTDRLYAVGVDKNGKLCVNVPWVDTNTDTNTTYTAGAGLTLTSTVFSLSTSGVTAGEYGPTTNVSGSNGAKIKVPQISVDQYGRVTKVVEREYTSVDTNTDSNTAHGHSAGGAGLTCNNVGGTSGTSTYTLNLKSTTSLGTLGTTGKLYAVGVDANGKLCVSVPWTDTNTDTNTTYSAGTGLSLSGTTFNLTNTTVSAGTYGPSANVSGSNGATIYVPQITVDAQGRITSVVNRTYTSVNTDTNTDTKVTQGKSTSSGWRAVLLHNTYTANYGTDPSQSTATVYYNEAIAVQCNTGALKATAVYGAVWNDYAEYRATKEEVEAGRVVIENGDDTLSLATERLMPGANIVSDTFGFAIGETEDSKTPLAVSGRALAYPYEDRDSYKPGDPVCSGPNGTVSKMTREEVMMYPDRILGTVSAIPEYETWGTGNVAVNGRIWIKVK